LDLFCLFQNGLEAHQPKNPVEVKKTLQITIPIVIHSNKLYLGAPSPIPNAAPRGAPNSRGDNNPKPIMPYLSQISDNFPFFGDLFP